MKDTYGFIKIIFKLFWFSVLCVAFYFLFFYEFKNYESQIPEKYFNASQEKDAQEILNMTFYYSDGNRLVPEDRKVRLPDSPVELVDNVLKEYLKGPANPALFNTLPENTLIRNHFLKDNVLYIDFSREIRVNYSGGLIPELISIYGIVNTICKIDTVKGVKFLINGEDTEVLISHIKTSEIIYPDEQIIQNY